MRSRTRLRGAAVPRAGGSGPRGTRRERPRGRKASGYPRLLRPQAESDCGQVLIVDTDTGTDTGADVDVIDGAPAFTVSRSCSRSEMPAVLKIAEGAAAAAAAAAAEGEVTVMTAGEAGASTAPNALWAALWAAWGAAEAPPLSAEEIEARAARDRAATAQSAMHSWDMRLRKAVSQHLETGAPARAVRPLRRDNRLFPCVSLALERLKCFLWSA